MPPPYGAPSLSDIAEDRQATELAHEKISAFFARGAEGLREGATRGTMSDVLRGDLPPHAGRSLVGQCGAETQKRYRTLLHSEAHFLPDGDYGQLIGPACQLLEAELKRLVSEPAETIAESLLAALKVRPKDRGSAEVLEDWLAKPDRSTLGTQVAVLLALRRGCEQDRAPITAFLAAQFRPRYVELLVSKQLAVCLDIVRNDFRNPACHGSIAFGPPKYDAFARLLVAQGRLAAWDVLGPEPPEPDAQVGVLHHHLSQSRQVGPEPSAEPEAAEPVGSTPLERLLGLRTPPESSLAIHVQPYHAEAASRVRSITVTPTQAGHSFHLQDEVRFGFQANRACHVALIDVGTSETVAVVWPNARCPGAMIDGGRPYFVPGIDFPEFQLTLTGQPGLERLVVVATLRPLPPLLLLPQEGAAFRSLASHEIALLLETIERLPKTEWAAMTCQFRIEPA